MRREQLQVRGCGGDQGDPAVGVLEGGERIGRGGVLEADGLDRRASGASSRTAATPACSTR